ncbi:hypothetical protein [Sphingomonas sp. Leaf25]|uniref:hypothetical protein n=1 Tax=Sphingomonas sp. Leaf25 TaxID=1735692 RepID=UPI0006F93638|nr:hypothetical protein [Sphingomonas sp. Leaf25]KQM96845.1 hypothetical protein ASE78_12950 [Sphingomonas sp. Leaf25]
MSTALLLAALLAQAPTPPVAPVPPKNPNERICRKMPAPTGSRVAAKRECHSATEWAAIDAANNSDVEQMRRRTSRQNY